MSNTFEYSSTRIHNLNHSKPYSTDLFSKSTKPRKGIGLFYLESYFFSFISVYIMHCLTQGYNKRSIHCWMASSKTYLSLQKTMQTVQSWFDLKTNLSGFPLLPKQFNIIPFLIIYYKYLSYYFKDCLAIALQIYLIILYGFTRFRTSNNLDP